MRDIFIKGLLYTGTAADWPLLPWALLLLLPGLWLAVRHRCHAAHTIDGQFHAIMYSKACEIIVIYTAAHAGCNFQCLGHMRQDYTPRGTAAGLAYLRVQVKEHS